ncbi:MAG: UDP-N-acetylglucosamine--N-acetylmuramyl-(pentapeptide) pyrophosphoryl-undecaprenol N-acetylglucosamine transferase [Alphaproteobacteria bacterium MarineAlpha9_Bin3]|nr:MAG: UDP-N-acetylglucosamine--N-acetylmuramyl-(pentapeptide) pyrophosphoryl-undecaprenol N-acetylglucosamine transferase [Alphaproteobacteria bacterium MarineAlpha9_Bin3]|tara:strand:+ start:17290 stop:18393 length:1104 start_codon:yes stop_codon:yes gene_type:complete
MKDTKNIFIVGGGTAGHVLPAIQVSSELIKNNYKVIFITDFRMFNFVNKNFKNKNFKLLCVKGRGIYKSSIYKNSISIYLFFYAIFQSLYFTIKYKPVLSYGFGGGITVAPLIISKVFRVPIILHEGNSILGKANKLLYRYANHLTTFFPKLDNNDHYKYSVIGMPVREDIEKIRKKNYTLHKKELINILITGGSLGAEVMATKITKALCKLPKKLQNKISILQQVRKENYSYVKKLYDKSSIKFKLEIYIENMPSSLNWCHLIICRSGAGTLAENLISGRPSIMIPLEISSDNHQMKNALMINKMGAGRIISEIELADTDRLINKLKSIIFNTKSLYIMSEKAKNNAIYGSSKKLVNLAINILNGK